MTTTDPDFIHLIESKRFQTSGISSPKNQARLKEEQKAYSNELISLRLVPPSSSLTLDNTTCDENNTSPPSKSTTWNISRFRLTSTFLTETVNRGRNDTLPKLHVTHLIDSRSKTVLLPSNDLRVQCRSSPVVYDVVTQLAGGIKQGGVLARSGDSYYNGDLLFLITNVPKQSSSGLFDVQPSDVHRWLVECATSSVEKIMIANDKIRGLNETLQQLEKTLANVHKAPIYNDKTGRAITGEALHVARENKRTSLLDEQKQTKSNLAAAEQALNESRLKHLRRMELSTKRTDDTTNKSNKISFSVKLHGKKKEYYTSLITNQKDWSLPLYATGSDLGSSNSSSNDSSEIALLDIMASEQAQHYVDTGSVSIVVLPDGSGVYEHYEETNPFSTSSTNNTEEQSRGNHTLFHGHFHEGEYREGTLHTDAGVFSGTFQSNGQPCKGKMKYSDGTVITGEFTLPPTSKGDVQCSTEEEEVDASPLGPNPYRLGLPRDNVSIQFKGGASYEGEMKYGTISGIGIYSNSQGEVDEDFDSGMIQNKDGEGGQGGSNLPRSLLFSGERLWGP